MAGGPLAGTAILPLFDFGELEGFTYHAMPLLKGPSLAAVLDYRRKPRAAAKAPPHPLAELPEPEYLGRVVEEASVDALFYEPKHPYTQALLRSIPKLGSKTTGEASRLASIRGTVPDPYNLPKGCPFHPRCNDVIRGVCDVVDPPVIEVGAG